MLKTVLYDEHAKLNAKIIDFGGWQMPVQYTNVIDEHTATRTRAGLFDICHMGEFMVFGPEAKDFLQYVITNDVDLLEDGKCFYSVLANENGGVIDDLFIYKMNNEKFMLVVNAGTIEKDFIHLQKNIGNFEVKIENISNNTAKLDIQGPKAKTILQKATKYNLKDLRRFEFIKDSVFDIQTLISRTGYTGEDGFELYFQANKAPLIWQKLFEIGKDDGLKPIGLGARDTLRLESSYSLYGHELNDETSPISAGIGFVVKTKKCNFIGKNILLDQKKNGAPLNLICFEMLDKAIPREHYDIYQNNANIGHVTSGTFSPTFKKGLGMGLITPKLKIDDIVDIQIRDNLYKAKIVKRPFYKYNETF